MWNWIRLSTASGQQEREGVAEKAKGDRGHYTIRQQRFTDSKPVTVQIGWRRCPPLSTEPVDMLVLMTALPPAADDLNVPVSMHR